MLLEGWWRILNCFKINGLQRFFRKYVIKSRFLSIIELNQLFINCFINHGVVFLIKSMGYYFFNGINRIFYCSDGFT